MSTSVVKCSEGLSNRMSIIIRRYIDQMKFAVYMANLVDHIFSYFSGSILYHCIYGCMLCVLLFNFLNYIFLLLCILIVMLGIFVSVHILIVTYVPFWVFCFNVLFYVLFVCKCVLYCTAATGCQPNCS